MMENSGNLKTNSGSQDSGFTNINVSSTSCASDGQEGSSNIDSGNLSEASASAYDNLVHSSHHIDGKTSASFFSSKGLENDGPYFEEDEISSSDSESDSSYCIKDGEEPDSTVREECGLREVEIFGNGDTNKTVFIPGTDFLPIYSSDYRNHFSYLMKDESYFHSRDVQNIFQNPPCLPQIRPYNKTIHLPSININGAGDDVLVQRENGASRWPEAKNPSKKVDANPMQIPVDLFYQLPPQQQNNDIKMLQSVVPKVLFDKLARELVKVKMESNAWKKNNFLLIHDCEKLRKEIAKLQQCKGLDAMCQMNVDLPSRDKFSMPQNTPESVVRGEGLDHFPHVDDDHKTNPRGIDVQQAKTGTEGVIAEHPAEYELSQILQEKHYSEMELMKRIDLLAAENSKYKEKLRTSEMMMKDEAKRAKNLETILDDERKRFARDEDGYKSKIKQYKAKLAHESDSTKKSSRNKQDKNKLQDFNSRGGTGSVDKLQYIKQGAIPKV